MPDSEDMPTPDEYGRYRVAETVDGQTRHYSTRRFIPGVHRIVEGPDAAPSFKNGQERPPKFPTESDAAGETGEAAAESPPQPRRSAPEQQPAPATTDSPEGAKA